MPLAKESLLVSGRLMARYLAATLGTSKPPGKVLKYASNYIEYSYSAVTTHLLDQFGLKDSAGADPCVAPTECSRYVFGRSMH